MKRFFIFLMAQISALSGFYAQTIQDGVLSNCTSITGRYVVPKEVKCIAPYAFFGSGVTEIVISPQVDSIGSMAFYGCLKLQKFLVEDGAKLSFIGDDAFSECVELTTVQLPPSLRHLGKRAFWLNSKLKDISIADGLEELQPYTFQGCVELTDITLPKSLKVIGENTFAGCKQLLSVEMPSCDSIATKAFYGCKLLGQIDLPSNLRSIADSAFMRCERMKTITLPASLQKVGAKIFMACPKMESINVATGNSHFISIDGVLFAADKSVLYEVPAQFSSDMYTLPRETKTIYHMAFWGCPKVQGITMHSEIDRIGIGALCNNGFKEIRFPGSEKYFIDENNLYYKTMDDEGNAMEVLMARASLDPRSDCLVRYGTALIADYALMGCSSLTSLRLPSTLLGINQFAFANCVELKDISSYAIEPPTVQEEGFSNVDGKKVDVHVYSKALRSYMIAPGWALLNYGSDLTGEEPTSIANPIKGPNYIVSLGQGKYAVSHNFDIISIHLFSVEGNELSPIFLSADGEEIVYQLSENCPHIATLQTKSEGFVIQKVL